MATDSNGNIILTISEPVTISLATNDSVIDNFNDRSIVEFTTSKRPLSNVEKFWTLYETVSGDLPLLTATNSWRQLFFDAKNNLGIDVVQVEKYDFIKSKVDALKTYTQILSTEMKNLIKVEDSSTKAVVNLRTVLNVIQNMQQELDASYPVENKLAAMKDYVKQINDITPSLFNIISNDAQIFSNVQNLSDTITNIDTVMEVIGTNIQTESLDEYLPVQDVQDHTTHPSADVLVNDKGKTNIV